MKTGLESIVESLEVKMHEGTIIKGTRIEKVAKQGDGYTITLSNGKEIEADAIVVATSHKVLPSMFAQYKQFRFFRYSGHIRCECGTCFPKVSNPARY